MALTFCDVPLLIPTVKDSEDLRRMFPVRDFFQLAFSEWIGPNRGIGPHLSPVPACDQDFNKLYWPRGASKWSYGFFLVTPEQLTAISAGVTSTGWGTLVFGDFATIMYALPPRYLNGKYLLCLVDERFFWWASSVEVDSGSEEEPTWAEVLTSLVALVSPATVSVDTVPSAYLAPPGGLIDAFEPVPVIIDRVCTHCGLRMVRQLDTTIEFQGYPTAVTIKETNALDNEPYRMMGGRFPLNTAGHYYLNTLVPARIVLVFNTVGTLEPYPITTNLDSLGLAEYIGPGDFDGDKVVHLRLVKDADEADGYSVADLEGFAAQWSQDWYLWALGDFDALYSGILFIDVEPLSFAVEWTYRTDQCTTRFYRMGERNFDSDRPPPSPSSESSTEPIFYVVKIPSGGIAARASEAISSENCDVYKTLSHGLVPAGITIDVYNLMPIPLDEGTYVTAGKDAFGQWYATAIGTEFEDCE